MKTAPLELIRSLVAIPAPPGQEEQARAFVQDQADALGFQTQVDPKGNLLIHSHPLAQPKIIVTAHLDEIALMVSQIALDGAIKVTSLGGARAWKWGEQPVEILTREESVPGVIGFGSIHTEAEISIRERVKSGLLTWDMAKVFTGLSSMELSAKGIRVGSRVVLARERRTIWQMGEYVAAYFLDDRALLAVMLMALQRLGTLPPDVLFAATVSEEVGGQGANYLFQRYHPDICIALEIGPIAPDNDVELNEIPTIWVKDSYASANAVDLEQVDEIGKALGFDLQYQALSRGGSDASCAAHNGLVAKPITLGIPVDNSHGLEIMHQNAPEQLTRLLVELLNRLA